MRAIFLAVLLISFFSDVFVENVSNDWVQKLYKMYRSAVDEDKSFTSLRRDFRNNKEYIVHVQNLKQVNGLKAHNLDMKRGLRSGKIIYINNPVESKIPHAYLAVEDFRTALLQRSQDERDEFEKSRSAALKQYSFIPRRQTRNKERNTVTKETKSKASAKIKLNSIIKNKTSKVNIFNDRIVNITLEIKDIKNMRDASKITNGEHFKDITNSESVNITTVTETHNQLEQTTKNKRNSKSTVQSSSSKLDSRSAIKTLIDVQPTSEIENVLDLFAVDDTKSFGNITTAKEYKESSEKTTTKSIININNITAAIVLNEKVGPKVDETIATSNAIIIITTNATSKMNAPITGKPLDNDKFTNLEVIKNKLGAVQYSFSSIPKQNETVTTDNTMSETANLLINTSAEDVTALIETSVVYNNISAKTVAAKSVGEEQSGTTAVVVKETGKRRRKTTKSTTKWTRRTQGRPYVFLGT